MDLDVQKIIDAAIRGGEVVKRYFGEALEIEQKSSLGDLRTKADIESEQMILEDLKKSFSEFNIYTEESGATNNKGLFGQDGVTEYGLVGSKRIAKAYKVADIWAYPTGFSEVDCITATKAMAAGTVPITTDVAVFPERNQGIFVNGDIEEKGTQVSFLEELISLLKDEDEKAKIRTKLDVSDYDWDIVAKRWADEMFES